jgi:divalent metal cation (Fe/Co/Zn/Cd) transporter
MVKAVQFCNVYSAGGGLIVEIDVLLPRDISLPKSHDICESIQYSIESLEGIQRACKSTHPNMTDIYRLIPRLQILSDVHADYK